jgi:hypothetical protein
VARIEHRSTSFDFPVPATGRLNLPAFGGFEDWSYRVREALIWLDWTDPCETSVDVRDSDPYRGELVTVVEQWKEHLVLNQDYTC